MVALAVLGLVERAEKHCTLTPVILAALKSPTMARSTVEAVAVEVVACHEAGIVSQEKVPVPPVVVVPGEV